MLRNFFYWLLTAALVLAIDQLLLIRLPVWLEPIALSALVGLLIGLLAGPTLSERGVLLADIGLTTARGALLGLVLAVCLTVTHAVFAWDPGPVLPALVWPTVVYWGRGRASRGLEG